MSDHPVDIEKQLAAERERADFAWENTRILEAAFQVELKKRDAAEREVAVLQSKLALFVNTQGTAIDALPDVGFAVQSKVQTIEAVLNTGTGDDMRFVEAAIAAIENRKLCAIRGANHFTFPFAGEDGVIFTDELRAKVEEKLGEPLIRAVLPGLEWQVSLVPASTKLKDAERFAVQVPENPFYKEPVRGNLNAMGGIGKERLDMIEEAFKTHDSIMSPDFERGRYSGTVTHISEHGNFFVQEIRRGRAVVHENEHMDRPVELGEVVSINYRFGRALVESKARDRGQGQER